MLAGREKQSLLECLLGALVIIYECSNAVRDGSRMREETIKVKD